MSEEKKAPVNGNRMAGRRPGNGGRSVRPGNKQPEKKPEPEGMAPRRIALRVIRQVTEQGAFASLCLDKSLENCGLISADRRLVSRLVYDTLDHLIYLDWCLGQVMAREDTDIKLRNILRLGACQILLEDRIPESAATNTCVQLCVENGMEGLKGVCNGILRNLVRKKDKADAIRFSLPEWLWIRLREAYGREEAQKILSTPRGTEGWTVRPNLTKLTDEDFEKLLDKKVWEKEKTDLPHAWRIRGAMDIARDADFTGGNFSIMTGGSMIACLAMDAKRGKQILDCCAAPGGKTCYLAELMGGTGRVQAWDLHEHRTSLIEAQAHALVQTTLDLGNGAHLAGEVLLDAPCTGLGMLAEKPDIKLRVTEESLRELTEIQRKMLDTVCAYVREGGTLVYSTCSILPEENEQQAEDFLRRHPEFEAAALPETVPEKYTQYRKTGLQLLEYRDGVEGFYVCRFRRKRI